MSVDTRVSLRQAAAEAWDRRQAEQAERKRQEIERAREHFVDSARHALRQAFAYSISDPFAPFREPDILAADIVVDADDDDLINRWHRVEARIVFAGETFEFKVEAGDNVHLLYHVWICPVCGERYEPPTKSNQINWLADLGQWIDHAESLHGAYCKAGQP